ncbi:hypothetical protein [Flavobacterium sp. GP15]|uniref:hypothetical protein n=1 Tax=Flavobacterium sp. GP15 TaxID=2758567 RepID=UPI00165D4C4D|nr:hypothetical protein [Flavobacterium sp. GP15]
MYTTCSCEKNIYRVSTCGIEGGGAGGNGETPSFPQFPTENQIIDFLSPEGKFIRYQFINNIWKIVLINLADVIVKSKPAKYSFLIFNYPVNQQKVYNDGMVYTFESEINTWSGVIATDELTAQAIEDQIDDSKLDPCTKAVLDKLKKLTQSDIADIFKKLGKTSTVYNLTYEIKPNNGNPGSTKQTAPNNYSTTLDSDFLYGIDGTGINKPPTNHAIAAVMIHEMVHTYFFSLFDDNKNNGVPKALDNFDILYSKYVSNQYVGADDAQHAQIWKSFIKIMASSLQEFNTGIPTDSPTQFYQDIMMGTLMTTNIFKSKYNEGSAEYNRIKNNYITEKKNGSNDPSYSPKGKPCQ